MKVKNTIPLPLAHLVEYIGDDLSLILIGASPHHIDILTIDPDTMGVVSVFPVETDFNADSRICFDDNCLYLPTKLGQILALDKFSGQILTTINTAMPIISDLFEDDTNIYCVCGVPISNKLRLIVDNFCICIFDKETGDKKIQTNYFSGAPCFLYVDEYIWVIAGTYLLQYDKSGLLKNRAHLGVPMDYTPVITDKHVILASADGLVRILNTDDLSFFTILRAKPNVSGPLLTEDNHVVWLTENSLCNVDYLEQGFREIKSNYKMNSVAELVDNKVFGCDTTGSLVVFDLEREKVRSVKLSSEPLNKPVKVENYLFISSASQLHQIEVQNEL